MKSYVIGGVAFGVFLSSMAIVISIMAFKKAPFMPVVGLVIIGLGIISIVKARNITLTIDKNTKKLTYTANGLLGKEHQEINTAFISNITLDDSMSATRSNNRITTSADYILVFHLGALEEVPIDLGSSHTTLISDISLGGKQKKADLGKIIADFIEVPFIDNRKPAALDIIENIKSKLESRKLMGNRQIPEGFSLQQTDTAGQSTVTDLLQQVNNGKVHLETQKVQTPVQSISAQLAPQAPISSTPILPVSEGTQQVSAPTQS